MLHQLLIREAGNGWVIEGTETVQLNRPFGGGMVSHHTEERRHLFTAKTVDEVLGIVGSIMRCPLGGVIGEPLGHGVGTGSPPIGTGGITTGGQMQQGRTQQHDMEPGSYPGKNAGNITPLRPLDGSNKTND